ncbi:hypothetical protein AX774_g7888 [Zancudomyces culisetae]|uniref:Uncharacterized protein n=1 Tax=Zancudomyces culisetae TaxID=1213189 RepID=A0A1R1PCR9_ZANCU|nr:hypothetical protein AX774_g7888 [Zancudomyces culisetae]|eukprot:OMH78719.1 hypothetical protein AX774_g7888 [Zancudomyces culisetae]
MDQTEQRVETGSVVSINIEKETQQNANVPPPDVGYAWVIFTAGALAIFTVFGSFNAFGLFQAYYLNIMFPTTSAQSISWIGTLTTTLTLGLGAIYGPLDWFWQVSAIKYGNLHYLKAYYSVLETR